MEQVEEQQAWPARAAQVCRTHPAILANIPLGSTQASQVTRATQDEPGYPGLNQREQLEYELDQLARDHLSPLDTINLSYYLNEFETNSCDLSDLLSNLMQNLLVKLPDPLIKYRLLNCIKQLYIDQADQQRASDEGFDEDEPSGSTRSAKLSPTKRQLDQRLFEATTKRYLVASSLLRCRSLAGLSSWPNLVAKQRCCRRSRRQRSASRLLALRRHQSLAPTPSLASGQRNLGQARLNWSSSDDDDSLKDPLMRATESQPEPSQLSRTSLNELHLDEPAGGTSVGLSSETVTRLDAPLHEPLADVADIASGPPGSLWKHKHYQPPQPSRHRHQQQQRQQQQQQQQLDRRRPCQQAHVEAPLDPSSSPSSIRQSIVRSLPLVSMHESLAYPGSRRQVCSDATEALVSPLDAACLSADEPTFAKTAHALGRLRIGRSTAEDLQLGPAQCPPAPLAGLGPHIRSELAYLERDWPEAVQPIDWDYNEPTQSANDPATWVACSDCVQCMQRLRKVVAGSEEQNGFSHIRGPSSGFQQAHQHSKPASTVSSSSLGSSSLSQLQTTTTTTLAGTCRVEPLVEPAWQVQPSKLCLPAYDYLAGAGRTPQARRHANGFRPPELPEERRATRCSSSMSVPCDQATDQAHYRSLQEAARPVASSGAHLATGSAGQYQWCEQLADQEASLGVSVNNRLAGPFESAERWAARGFRASLPASPVAHDKLGRVYDQRRLEAPTSAARSSLDQAPQLNKSSRKRRQHHHGAPGQANHPNEPLFTPNRRRIWSTPEQPNGECQGEQSVHFEPTCNFAARRSCARHTAGRKQLEEDELQELEDREAALDEQEEVEGEEEEEALAIVAAPVDGRLSMSVAEQMKAQASSFVHQYGSSNLMSPGAGARSTRARRQGQPGSYNSSLATNHKPELQVRRTLRVKIKKSKPILGIAIEGGFNVSGQLLPRIVCVHEDGAAYQCGKLRASDLILEVNGLSTVDMTHDEIAKTIASAYYQDSRPHIEFLIGESVHVSRVA